MNSPLSLDSDARATPAKPRSLGSPNWSAALGVEDDRHRAVVHDLDLHAGAEGAGRDRDPLLPERGAERLVERLGLLRPRGGREARAVALGRVGDQRELADDERRAARVEEAPVELPLLVLEDPQARDLAGEPVASPPRRLGDAEQDAEPGADRADLAPSTRTRASRTRWTTARTASSSQAARRRDEFVFHWHKASGAAPPPERGGKRNRTLCA